MSHDTTTSINEYERSQESVVSDPDTLSHSCNICLQVIDSHIANVPWGDIKRHLTLCSRDRERNTKGVDLQMLICYVAKGSFDI